MDTILILIILGTVGIIAWYINERRSGVDSATVTRAPEEIISLAVASIPRRTASIRSSWMPAGNSDRSASFTYQRRKSILATLFLLLLGLVPGILYLALGGKNQSLQVSVLSGTDGCYTVQVAASGATARRRGRSFLNSLTKSERQLPAELRPAA